MSPPVETRSRTCRMSRTQWRGGHTWSLALESSGSHRTLPAASRSQKYIIYQLRTPQRGLPTMGPTLPTLMSSGWPHTLDFSDAPRGSVIEGFRPDEHRQPKIPNVSDLVQSSVRQVQNCVRTDSYWQPISGASDGNRTRATSLGSWSSTIELHSRIRPLGICSERVRQQY